LLRELRRRRKAASLTQTELGAKLFCSDSLVSAIETGTKPVTLDHLKLVDKALGEAIPRRQSLDLIKEVTKTWT
jgi:transcriptional regulator with XRE-family HTH domain